MLRYALRRLAAVLLAIVAFITLSATASLAGGTGGAAGTCSPQPGTSVVTCATQRNFGVPLIYQELNGDVVFNDVSLVSSTGSEYSLITGSVMKTVTPTKRGKLYSYSVPSGMALNSGFVRVESPFNTPYGVSDTAVHNLGIYGDEVSSLSFNTADLPTFPHWTRVWVHATKYGKPFSYRKWELQHVRGVISEVYLAGTDYHYTNPLQNGCSVDGCG